jgi:hypothetical protein
MCDRSHLAHEARVKELRAVREALLDELDALRAGTGDAIKADVFAERAASIIERCKPQ